jgi:uncharacterized protein with ParB-like and HNH nuclease domain
MENNTLNLELDKTELINEISSERKNLSSDRMDISFGEIINMYKDGELIIRPEYQRLFRWDNSQKTALIESILLSIPIPPIFVAEDNENGKWELIDGLQRISTIISFFGELKEDLTSITCTTIDEIEVDYRIQNKWTLESGGIITKLENFNIDNLPKNLVINIKRSVCRVEILRGDSNYEMKYELFKRLNSGGSILTPQEIRNAIFRGVNPIVNELLLDAANDDNFQKLTSLSSQKKSELYDQELALRFFAFVDNSELINENTENYLNKYMKESVGESEYPKQRNLDRFKQTLSLLAELNDDKIFRNENNFFVPAWYEGITIGVANSYDRYKVDIELLRDKIFKLRQDSDFKKFSGSASNSRSRVKKRLKRAIELFSE